MPVSKNFISCDINFVPDSFITESLPDYTPISRLSDSMSESMRMMSKMQEIRKALPGIDCGACGAPTCRAFAEDIVRGVSNDRKCVVLEHNRTEESDGGSEENDS
jgi:ArsR family metal-binding transcriptional regulator